MCFPLPRRLHSENADAMINANVDVNAVKPFYFFGPSMLGLTITIVEHERYLCERFLKDEMISRYQYVNMSTCQIRVFDVDAALNKADSGMQYESSMPEELGWRLMNDD